MTQRVAAIDCGTNSVKLLIAEFGADSGAPHVLLRTSEVVRLGEGVDATGQLSEAALARTFAAVEAFAALIEEFEVPRASVRFCATSATRDASNSADFTSGVLARLGVVPEVIAGSQEAALGFAGATAFADPRPVDPVLVVDIGGGSTEFALGTVAGGVTASISLDIGSVRLTERTLLSDPPTAAEVARCVAQVDAALDRAEAAGVSLASAASVLGTSGTVKQVAALHLQQPVFDRDALDGAVLDVVEVLETCADLLAMTVAQRLEVPSMHPGRADVIGAGAVILARLLARITTPTITVSEADLLYGIAGSLPR